MATQRDRDQINRLWEHRLHEDNIFNERQNFFLVSQSMLLIAYVELLSAFQLKIINLNVNILNLDINKNIPVAKVFTFLGGLLTLVWVSVNIRMRGVVKHVHKRAIKMIPEFKETYQTRRSKWPIKSTLLIAYVVPILFLAIWVIFFFVV